MRRSSPTQCGARDTVKAWIARFRGVATKHLPRYRTWHIMDERIQRLTAAKARAVLVGNTAELSPDRWWRTDSIEVMASNHNRKCSYLT